MVDTLRLALNATDVRELTGWPDAMVEDYIQILGDLTQIIAQLNQALLDIGNLFDNTESINGDLQSMKSIVSLLKAKVKFARQEVFIDEQPAINYPAVSYADAGGGLYIQSVNA